MSSLLCTPSTEIEYYKTKYFSELTLFSLGTTKISSTQVLVYHTPNILFSTIHTRYMK